MKTKVNKKDELLKMAIAATLVSLAAVLSNIKVWQMPLGGSVTLFSMLPVVLISVMCGLKWGFIGSFVYSVTQLLFGIFMSGLLGWGLTPTALVGAIAFDYILPFTCLGIAGIFRKKGHIGVCLGVGIAVVLRFICHLISGAIVFDIWCEWDNAWVYSFCYNGAYMLPELVITVLGAIGVFSIIFSIRPIRRLIANW